MNLQRLKKNLLHIILEQGGEPILSSQYDPVLLAKDICFFPELCSPNFGCVLAAHWKAFNTNAHKYLAHYRKCLMKGKKHGTFIPHCSKYRSIRTSSLNWLLGEGQHVDVSAPGQVWSSKTAGSFICRQSALRRRQGTRYDTQAYSWHGLFWPHVIWLLVTLSEQNDLHKDYMRDITHTKFVHSTEQTADEKWRIQTICVLLRAGECRRVHR